MASLKIKKGFVVGLASWLNELALSGRQSRERTRFVKDLIEEYKTVDLERIAIVESFASKEEDGQTFKKVSTVDNSGKEIEGYDIPDTDMPEVNKQIADLFQEDYIVDITEANKERMAVIKDIILNTDYKFGPKEEDTLEEKQAKVRQAGDYDLWCEAFETIEV